MAHTQTMDMSGAPSDSKAAGRVMQLVLGFIVMMTISSPQYVWTLFTGPFQKTTGAILSEVQWTITILIVLQTWLSPLQGWLVDRFGLSWQVNPREMNRYLGGPDSAGAARSQQAMMQMGKLVVEDLRRAYEGS